MLINSGVRNVMVVSLLVCLLLTHLIAWLLTWSSTLLVAISATGTVMFCLLWLYITQYLISPLNRIKRRPERGFTEIKSIVIPALRTHCASRSFSGINSIRKNIIPTVSVIRSNLKTAIKRSLKIEQPSPAMMGAPSGRIESGNRNAGNVSSIILASLNIKTATRPASKGGKSVTQEAQNWPWVSNCAQQLTGCIEKHAFVKTAGASDYLNGLSLVAREISPWDLHSGNATEGISSLTEIPHHAASQQEPRLKITPPSTVAGVKELTASAAVRECQNDEPQIRTRYHGLHPPVRQSLPALRNSQQLKPFSIVKQMPPSYIAYRTVNACYVIQS